MILFLKWIIFPVYVTFYETMKSRHTSNLADVDIRLLRVFQSVVERGGFSAAETALNIGRSAISRYMADLEARLGLRLCERGRSGFSLTDHGQAVYDETLQLFSNIEQFNEKVSALRGILNGTLRIGTVDDTAPFHRDCIAGLIRNIKQRGPELRVHLEVGSPDRIERGIIQGRIHAGVVPVHRQVSGLTYYPLHHEEMRLYCAPGHWLFEEPENKLDETVISECEFAAPSFFHRIAPAAIFDQFVKTAKTNQVEGVAILVHSGSFLGFLPQHYAKPWVEKGSLRDLLPDQYSYKVPFALIVQSSRKPETFRDLILEEIDSQLDEIQKTLPQH